MFRSQYDTDVTVWSPQGRLLQVEYAMEAVKQGSACLGLVGKDGVVLAALKRQPNELSGHQKKLLKIDDHLVIAVAGLNADARTHGESHAHGVPPITDMPVWSTAARRPFSPGHSRQVPAVHADVCQKTLRRRVVGGLLRCHGPPPLRDVSVGNFSQFVAVAAIGARAQSAKTLPRKHHKTFKDTPVEELCTHAYRHWPVWKSTGVPLSRHRGPRFGSNSDTTPSIHATVSRATPFRREIPNRRALEVLFPHRHWPVASLATRSSMPLLLR